MRGVTAYCRLAALALMVVFPSRGDAEEQPFAEADALQLFARTIQPLFAQKCLACHGDKPDDLKGVFDLRSRESLLAGGASGEPGIVPHRPEESVLLQAIRWEGLEMPPKENDRLTAREINAVRRWIAAGAPWPGETDLAKLRAATWDDNVADGVRVTTIGGLSDAWTNRRYDPADLWAYQPLQRPEVPQVAETTTEGQPHPIDAFIAARLRAAKLSPAPRADANVLLRRLSYDLTGLPPSEELRGLLNSDTTSPTSDAVINRLLASPAYGERMAQHWLDVVRYADTNGYARDEFRPTAWQYRNYVIDAFNSDRPYDEFVREQIAGDELTKRVPVATSFLWMGPWEHTSMNVAAETRQLWLDDVTNSVGVTFLAHELRCAKCHDHKFDPIATRDYYGMQAAFASTVHNAKAGDFRIRAREPEVTRVLLGGALDNIGPEVQPGVLSAISSDTQLPASANGRRLALAQWIASAENPLTARVIANRVWQMHFGRGLVASSSNFGKMGSRPTNPQLLDWLATWLIDNGWSLKKLHRLIVTSETYQRSTQHPQAEAVAKIDPDNALLSYFPARRLTAEELRDSLLVASGELNAEVGGPSVFPKINWEVAFQPRLLMGQLGAPYEPSSKRADRNRRTLYAARIRGLRDPLLETFNQPGSELSCERRVATTVAPQALTMLHGEFVHERAISLADRIARSHASDAQRIDAAFRSVVGRAPAAREAELTLAHLRKQTALHAAQSLEAQPRPVIVTLEKIEEKTCERKQQSFELKYLKDYEEDLQPWNVDAGTRALADVCLVLFNTSEFLYVY